jgi:peptidoglycan hydrolase-like protein with peptidoglycan-binding domain
MPRTHLPIPLVPPPPHYRHERVVVGDSTVAQVQRALKRRGYYAGPVDGDAGSGTREAIRGFRADRGLPPSSRIDGTLMRALGL